jgi:hypothetical protein
VTDREAIQGFIAYGQFAPIRIQESDTVAVWFAEDGNSDRSRYDWGSQIDNTEYPAGWMVDVIVLPTHRGQSAGHRLHEAGAVEAKWLP